MEPSEINSKFVALSIADSIFRITLSVVGPFLVKNLTYCYFGSALLGFLLSFLWNFQTSASSIITVYCMCKYLIFNLIAFLQT